VQQIDSQSSKDRRFRVLDYNESFRKDFSNYLEDIDYLETALRPEYAHIFRRIKRAAIQGRKNIRIVFPEIPKTFEVGIDYLSAETFIVSINDVTEEAEDLRVQLMEQALERSKKQYELLFNEMKSIFVIFKLDAQESVSVAFADANPAFEALVQQQKRDFVGASALESPLLKDTMLLANVEFVYDSGIPVHYQEHNIAMGCYLDVSLYKLEDSTVALVANDVTGLKNAEIALKASEERYRSLLETADDRIAVFSLNMELKFANPAFYSKLGYTKDDYPKSKDGILGLFFEPEKFLSIIKGSYGKEHLQCEYQVRHKNGNLMAMHAYFQPLKVEGGEDEILVVSRDITELKEHEERLRKAKEKAEESDKLKSSFLANMSHEIRTPLNGILGFSKLLSRPNLSDEKRLHYINLIDNNGAHLLSIISDILDIAKIESNQLEVHFASVNLNEQLDSLLAMSKTILNKKDNNRVAVSVSKGLAGDDAIIVTDSMRLTQIMRNLIENALKFTDSGTVNFGYKLQDDRSLCFYVKDTGIGISSDKLSIIFEHFRQEDETITRKYGGTGLGLSICKHLVKRLGGILHVESEKGQGTKFFFTLPYNKPQKNDVTFNWDMQNSFKKNTNSLSFACCVSDEMKNVLETMNLPVAFHFITSFRELEEIAKKNDCKAVFIDFAEPKQTIESVRTIKERKPFMPVFATINKKESSDATYYSQVGVTDVIDLQIDEKALLALLQFYFEL